MPFNLKQLAHGLAPFNKKKAVDPTNLFGHGFFAPIKPKLSGELSEKFLCPPFSVLDSKSADWKRRKRAWIGTLDIDSSAGRKQGLLSSGGQYGEATSVFDPVLAELIYRWWCPAGGQILDPFAGGSVRGIVATALRFRYWGSDISKEQVQENRKQASRLELPLAPEWVIGDSRVVVPKAPLADLVFSCPPYFNLEKYSDADDDLSAMSDYDFSVAYAGIIEKSVARLKQNRFACFVVSNARGKDGFYRDLVGLTVSAFEEVGARFYNDAVFLTPLASAAVRATRIMDGGRKLTPVHQHILVFCKGDWKAAATQCMTK